MHNASSERSSNDSAPKGLFRKIRNEIAFEVAFVIICFCLAIGFNAKIVLAVVLTCLKFALPDFVTAYLVVKHDPSFSHGVGVAFLFLATGMARASQFAFIALMATACILVPMFGGAVGGNFFAVGLGTGFICAFLFLGSVFPLSLIAVLIARTQGIKLSFARKLTKLRRMSEKKRNALPPHKRIKLDVERSTNLISMAAAAGLAVCLISVLFLNPKQGLPLGWLLLIAAFVLPLIWIPIMFISIYPKEENSTMEVEN